MQENEIYELGKKTAKEGITLDEMRQGIAYNATYIGMFTPDEMDILEEGYMAYKMSEEVA